MRVEGARPDCPLDPAEFTRKFAPLAERFGMRWRLELSALPHRVALFVSKYDHCLVDLLYRHQSGELPCDIPCVVSNHPDSQSIAEFYRIPFYLVPVEKDSKQAAEGQILALLERNAVDFIVLARYMQILSTDFVDKYPN